jgi:hypothetical protein
MSNVSTKRNASTKYRGASQRWHGGIGWSLVKGHDDICRLTNAIKEKTNKYTMKDGSIVTLDLKASRSFNKYAIRSVCQTIEMLRAVRSIFKDEPIDILIESMDDAKYNHITDVFININVRNTNDYRQAELSISTKHKPSSNLN